MTPKKFLKPTAEKMKIGEFLKKTKIKIILIILIILIVFIVFNIWLNTKPDLNKISDCNLNTDCVIVQGSYCGRAEAINKEYINDWDNYLKKQDIFYSFPWNKVMCKVSLPLDYFEAQCSGNKCRVIQIK